MIDSVEAFFNIGIKHVFGFMANSGENRLDRIVTGSTRSEAIAVGFKARFPFGFQRAFNQRLARSIRQGWNT